ncbi:MAG: phosphatidylglycerophosphatase A [Bacteroidetes bacterium]|nr:phosphatidylglycerophosphatase A [Rhodothermia bacterium]MCS7156026.1 phosphatidylglycerophosphatase A [Bacteroidota bacterium]MCX7907714.1 phosphatidylglycerophosphatase A [Bacteroidota bacterium]MDW8137843.1 phosphatidylglycerophosphatase A [Bacteroidota bacterium]MDW8286306.1 phosphatidylglycerophosphatase A [Bacteroidota bacterium]
MNPTPPVWARLLSTGFGIGLFPYGPGTLASLTWTLLYAVSGLAQLPLWGQLLGIAGLFGLALQASQHMQRRYGPDPPRVVVDEWIGQWLALLPARAEWPFYALAFGLFRALDILKPGPIQSLQRLPGAWGLLLDDVAAGLGAALGVELGALIWASATGR